MSIYATPTWQIVRVRALVRDGYRCVARDDDWRPCAGPLTVHHVRPVGEGGEPFALSNLVTLCRRHHGLAHGDGYRRTPAPCPHHHPTRAGRIACERRRAA